MAKKAPKKTPTAPKQVEGELLDADPSGPAAFPAQFPAEASERTTSSEDTESGADSGEAGGMEASTTPLAAELDRTEVVGDVEFTVAADVGSSRNLVVRLPLARARDGETKARCWERLRRESRAAGMTRRGSVAYAGRQAERLFPHVEPIVEEPAENDPEPDFQNLENSPPPEPIPVAPAPISDDQGVSGLGDLPSSWPKLAANAPLHAEIAWVSANRLLVRDGTGVDLSKALSPAPSYSALSWLETAILFPAKFADTLVKAPTQQDDEREFIKREKMAIEEIRSILAEMLEAGES